MRVPETLAERFMRQIQRERSAVRNSSDKTPESIPDIWPKPLARGESVVRERHLEGPVHALEIGGEIDSSGPAELRDLVVHVDFFDAAGAAIDGAGSGLTRADSGRHFFYPVGLIRRDTGHFAKTVLVPPGTRRVVASLSVWRFRDGIRHVARAFGIRDGRQIVLPAGAGFSGMLDMLVRQGGLDLSGSALDVASTLPRPEETLVPVARAFGGPVDCLALYPNPKVRWMDTRRMLDMCRAVSVPSGPYALVSIHPHVFSLGNLLLQLRGLYPHLSPDGVIVVSLPMASLDVLSAGATGLFAGLDAELAKGSVPLEILALAPPAEGAKPDPCWIALRRIEWSRLFPDFFARVSADDLPAAAAMARDLCVGIVTGRHGPVGGLQVTALAERFAGAVPALDKAGRYDEALNCLLCAAALDPDKPNLRLEVAGRCRGRGDTATAQAILEHFLVEHPGHAGALLNLALVFSLTGRGLEAMDMGEAYLVQAGVNVTESARRALSTLLRNFARECASAGQQTDAVDPLLDPEIAKVFFADPETHAGLWFRPRLTRLFAQDASERRGIRDLAQAKAGPVPADRKLRVLFCSAGVWPFVLKMVRQLDLRGVDIEFRSYDLSALGDAISKNHLHEVQTPVSVGGDAEAVWSRVAAEHRALADLVDWCDIVFCEWAGLPAIWLSRYLPPHKRLVVRLHSYEVFSSWPCFINFGGVDGMIFVADHIRRIADLRFRFSEHCPRSIVLQNFNDPSAFSTAKAPGAHRTLGMLGYANRNKDPLFAARILAELRETDPEWRLMLVGDDWDEDRLTEAQRDYCHAFRAFVAERDLSGAIEHVPFTTRIEEPLARIGFILSCSHREGTHEAILEGMASGAVPVIRRWPMVSRFGAPDTSYPGLACVDTVEEAVAQIRAQADPESFAAATARAAAYARRQFDPAATTDAAMAFLRETLATPGG